MSKPVPYTHVFSNKEFIAQYKKVDVRIRKAVAEKIRLFQQNPYELRLNNHPLRDIREGYRSIDTTTDYRAVYKEVKEGGKINAYFFALGTHKELYG
jgi:mRNA-degrading endonuclease YafQ of YafQ-DinJ toxin-antitoxin module